MPPESVIERAFSGGELTPAAYARVDQSKYQTGLRTLRNRICMRHGGVTQRPGTMYVGTTLNNNNQVRLIPFIFNETGLGQSYVLEFGNQYIAFYQNGGVVISGGNPYTIVTPYLQSELSTLQFDQSADTIIIVHPNHAPMKLVRNAPTSWTLSQIAFGIPFSTGGNPVNVSGGGSGSVSYLYIVCSVDLNGNETPLGGFTGGATNINQPSPTNPVTITWSGPAGGLTLAQVSFWNIYRADWTASGASPFGYVGTVPASPQSFLDTIGLADFSNTPPQTSPFESLMGAGYYPSTCAFVQQRLGFAAWNNNPVGFALSKPGSFFNFDIHTGASTPDDDPILGSIYGGEVNSIQHLLELKFMLMFTAGAELFLQGNGSGVVTPSAINASTQSQYGASPLRPLKVGDVCLFNQSLGSFIRDFVFDFVIDGYRGNDITMFSSHLFEGYQIVDWAYQKIPDSIIWAVRSDGVLLSCTYLREQQILSWARHDYINGFVENVISIPENGSYALYLSIRRIINGITYRYLERLSSRIWQGPSTAVASGTANAYGDPIDAAYLDCYSMYDGRNQTPIGTIAAYQIITGVNDSIDLLFDTDGGNYPISGSYTAYIASGIYTATTLCMAVASALNALGISSGGFPITWNCALSGSVLEIWQTDAPHQTINPYTLLFKTGPHVATTAALTLGWPNADVVVNANVQSADAMGVLAPQISQARAYYITMTLSVSGSFQTGNTAYQQLLMLTASNSYFNFGTGHGGQPGDEIVLEDAMFVSSQGSAGQQIRCTIQSVSSLTVAIVTPNKAVPVEFQKVPTILWARAVKIVSGLGYLQGQKVSIWADRFLVGSALNPNIETLYMVPPIALESGNMGLDKCYAVIYVGLPMVADFETLAIDTSFGDSMTGEPKNISEIILYLYNTRGFWGGTQNPDTDPDNLVNGVVQDPLYNLIELKAQANRQTYDAPPGLETGAEFTSVECNWSKEGRIFIRNIDPVPQTILAVIPAGLTSAKIPYSQKV
jgi:hypothetical protein